MLRVKGLRRRESNCMLSTKVLVVLTICFPSDFSASFVTKNSISQSFPSPHTHWLWTRRIHHSLLSQSFPLASFDTSLSMFQKKPISRSLQTCVESEPLVPNGRFVSNSTYFIDVKSSADMSFALWKMTAPVWQRGIMEEHYDLPQSSMTWVTGAVEPSATQRKEKIKLDLPSNLSVTPIGPGKCLSQVSFHLSSFSMLRLTNQPDACRWRDWCPFLCVRSRVNSNQFSGSIIFDSTQPSSYNTSDNVEHLFPNFKEVEKGRWLDHPTYGTQRLKSTLQSILRKPAFSQSWWVKYNLCRRERALTW